MDYLKGEEEGTSSARYGGRVLLGCCDKWLIITVVLNVIDSKIEFANVKSPTMRRLVQVTLLSFPA